MADFGHDGTTLVPEDATDRELIEFFAAFDDVVATDELKDATLAAIFLELDAQERADTAGEQAEDASTADVTLEDASDDASTGAGAPDVEAGDAMVGAADLADAPAPADAPVLTDVEEPATARLAVVEGNAARRGAVSRRRGGMRLRIAAAVATVALVTAGGVAYAVPSSRMTVTEGDTTVELGINMFGRTISAEADTVAGRKAIDGLDVRHLGAEDALDRVLDRLDDSDGDGSVDVQIDGGLGNQRNHLDAMAGRVIDRRGLERGANRHTSVDATGNNGNPASGGNASSEDLSDSEGSADGAPRGGAPTGAPIAGTSRDVGATSEVGGAPNGASGTSSPGANGTSPSNPADTGDAAPIAGNGTRAVGDTGNRQRRAPATQVDTPSDGTADMRGQAEPGSTAGPQSAPARTAPADEEPSPTSEG